MLQLTARLERMNQYVGRGHDLGIPAEQVAAAEAVIEALKRVPGAASVASSSPEAPPPQAPTPAGSQPEAHSPMDQVWAMIPNADTCIMAFSCFWPPVLPVQRAQAWRHAHTSGRALTLSLLPLMTCVSEAYCKGSIKDLPLAFNSRPFIVACSVSGQYRARVHGFIGDTTRR